MMNWLKKMFAKKVDERQEMDLLRIEHSGFWLMYFLLFIEIIIQGMILGEHDKIVGEGIVFVVVSVFLLIGCARKGVWTYQSQKVPGVKSYLWYSLVAGVLAGIIGVFNGLKWTGNVPALMANMIVMAAGTFVLTFIVFLIVGGITKKREKKLEMEAIGDDGEDE